MINRINLSGEWAFEPDEVKTGIKDRFYERWGSDTIILPSTTSIAHKGKKNTKCETGFLTDEYAYEGYAWYYKKVTLGSTCEGRKTELFLERTRLTSLWINGSKAGECDSLCTPHVYDITDYIDSGEIEICILVSNTDYPTKGGHMTSPDTQSNWNGITGEISLIVSEKEHISFVQAYPDAESKSVRLAIELEGTDSADIEVWGASTDGKCVDKCSFHITAQENEIMLPLGRDASLWSEHTPDFYRLALAIKDSADVYHVSFGLRSFKADGMSFTINGREVYLRGKHDGMIFPLTGAAPTTVEEWCDVLAKAKEWGINHYRFHTCCPPDAAFTAADMLGIYMQPELPFWGTITEADDENHDENEQQYLIEEGRRILKTFGNHPSFVMMSLGNELWGSSSKLAEILREYRRIDSRHLYTQGSNNYQFWPLILEEDDFFSGVRLSKERLIRGSYAACDMPFGFVQTDKPNTIHSYDRLIFPESDSGASDDESGEIEIQYGTGVKKVKVDSKSKGLIPTKPIVTHEVGQYCVYPDFNEIEKYTGVLKARNFGIFRERLSEKGMLHLADLFFRASGALSAQCYKIEIEAAMRSEHISGFQLLDLQDFSGQGTALVGMLDAFMDSKNLITAEKWRGFCSDTVVLAGIEDFAVTVHEKFTANVKLRHMGADRLSNTLIRWNAISGDKSYAGGAISVPDNSYGLISVGEISFEIPELSAGDKLILTVSAENEGRIISINEYELAVFPKADESYTFGGKSVSGDTVVYISADIQEVKKRLAEGERVIYLPNELPESIEATYCTDFWCYPMFRSISESMGKQIPVGTLGLLIDNEHKALEGFACGIHTTPQWFGIISDAECAVLDKTPSDYRPVVQMIDNFERNHKLGILYEARVGSGRLIVCTSRLSAVKDSPEVQAFAKSILAYAHSEDFTPSHELGFEELGIE